MAVSDIKVYLRIRLPTEADIIAMAVARFKYEDIMPIVDPYVDVSMRPFNDNALSILPEELADLVKTIKVTNERSIHHE